MLFLTLVTSYTVFALEQDTLNKNNEIESPYGLSSKSKFSFYNPTYMILSDEDIKAQLSGKYRFAKSHNIYMAYTQLMFWNIYEESKPFKDIIFNPEAFYRLIEKEFLTIQSVDFGYSHHSNGKDLLQSRSLDKIYLKINSQTMIYKRNILTELQLYYIRNMDDNNYDIREHLGFWDIHFYIKDIFQHHQKKIDFEFKIFAGNKIINFDKGARVIGLIYQSGSLNFNPSIYLQYYSGYTESLLGYQDRVDNIRIGLILYL